MARAAFETSATFQDLWQFLGESGCAVCRQEAQSDRRYFDTLLAENVTSPATEARLRASGGFCRRHLATLLARREAMATAILYRSLLLDAQRQVAAWRAQRTRRAGPGMQPARPAASCPACEAEAAGGRRAAEVLAAGLNSGVVRERWQASQGLCWPHFLSVRPLCRAGREVLEQIQSERLGALAADIEELISSFDYRNESGRSEQAETAWRRLAEVMAGRVLGGRPVGGG